VGVDDLLLGRRPAWPQPPGLWWCKHRDRRGAEMEIEAMATRQTSKQAKTKATAKVDTRVINKPVRNSEREPERRNPRAGSRATAGQVDQAAAADGAVVHDKPKQIGSRPKLTAGRTDLEVGTASGANQPPASTKRAKLIMMLKRPEGASVAEIGQRLGWLPHTVRAAITGLRQDGREVTRSKDVDDRSIYRLARLEPASQR